MGLSRRHKAALVVLGIAVVGVGAVGAILWRGVPFPPLTGPHLVGRTSYHLIDASRPEFFSEAEEDVRELMVTVHYPAEKGAKEPLAAYADARLAAGVAEAFHTPSFVGNSMRSHALESPRCREQDGGYPVVIFSPGFGTPPLFYTAMLEQLASHGFVVVSVYHPYSNGVTVFPDGRVVRQNEAGSNTDSALGDPEAPQEPVEPQPNDVGAVWVRDVRFVLDELARLNRDDKLLAERLDLSKVGMFGHSFGGATAARTVQIDRRFRAGINMDGTDFSVTAGATIDRPLMWLCSPPREMTDAELAESGKTRDWADASMRMRQERSIQLLNNTVEGARAVVRGAGHQTFTSDFVLLGATPPWSWLVAGADIGSIPGKRARSLVDALVVGYFQKHLQGQSAPFLEGATDELPEIEWQFRQP